MLLSFGIVPLPHRSIGCRLSKIHKNFSLGKKKMALETVVYPQDIFCNNNKEVNNLLLVGGFWGGGCPFDDDLATKFDNVLEENFPPSQKRGSPTPNASSDLQIPSREISHDPEPQSNNSNHDMLPRSKRRRSRPKKNQEEIERQRMAHIAVERNRRKQMNEYLSVLRGLMPGGYVHKGDQASIVGGAINYVKELEQQLQFLDGQNHVLNQEAGPTSSSSSLSSPSSPFSEFLNYPQYSTALTGCGHGYAMSNNPSHGGKSMAAADIEVAMVESSHANLKVRSKKRPKQLIKLVSGLQGMRLTILHLNVTTAGQTVFYSLSLKVEEDCKLNSADEIAAAVNQIFTRVQEEAVGLNK